MAHACSSVLVHIVFTTRGRERWLSKEVRAVLFNGIGRVCAEMRSQILCLNAVEDHVHLLLVLGHNNVPDLVKNIKTKTSISLKARFPNLSHFSWKPGYGAFSVAYKEREIIIDYIQRQEEHHKRYSSFEEFTEFLREHGLYAPDTKGGEFG